MTKDSAKYMFHGTWHSCMRSTRSLGIIPEMLVRLSEKVRKHTIQHGIGSLGETHTELEEYSFSVEILIVIDLSLRSVTVASFVTRRRRPSSRRRSCHRIASM